MIKKKYRRRVIAERIATLPHNSIIFIINSMTLYRQGWGYYYNFIYNKHNGKSLIYNSSVCVVI